MKNFDEMSCKELIEYGEWAPIDRLSRERLLDLLKALDVHLRRWRPDPGTAGWLRALQSRANLALEVATRDRYGDFPYGEG